MGAIFMKKIVNIVIYMCMHGMLNRLWYEGFMERNHERAGVCLLTLGIAICRHSPILHLSKPNYTKTCQVGLTCT